MIIISASVLCFFNIWESFPSRIRTWKYICVVFWIDVRKMHLSQTIGYSIYLFAVTLANLAPPSLVYQRVSLARTWMSSLLCWLLAMFKQSSDNGRSLCVIDPSSPVTLSTSSSVFPPLHSLTVWFLCLSPSLLRVWPWCASHSTKATIYSLDSSFCLATSFPIQKLWLLIFAPTTSLFLFSLKVKGELPIVILKCINADWLYCLILNHQ